MAETKNLEDYRKLVASQAEARLKQQVAEMADDILGPDGQEPNATIPEEVFEYYFLDFFKHSSDPKYKKSPLWLKWCELSGGYYKEVDIINTDGNTILTVPALVPKPEINTKGLSESHLKTIGTMYQEEAKRFPQLALNNMRDQFGTLPEILANNDAMDDAKVKLTAIFTHYDKKQKEQAEAEDSVNHILDNNLQGTPESKSKKEEPRVTAEDLGISFDD